MATNGKKLLTEREVANELGMSPSTLRSWRSRGYGPPYIKLGEKIEGTGRVRYPRDGLDEWLAANRVEHELPEEHEGAAP